MKNLGLQLGAILSDQYILGDKRLGGMPLTDGHWLKWLPPEPELQYNQSLDTSNCTGFGSTNVLEILLRFKFQNTINWNPDYDDFSERALGIMAGTRPPGNDPHKVAEAMRKGGLVAQRFLPFNESIKSIAEYYSPDPLTQDLVDKGKEFLAKWSIGHDWLSDYSPDGVLEALKHSPLGIAVYGWKERNGLYYKEKTDAFTHWVALVDYEYGKHWVIYDSYLADGIPLKKLEWNYPFEYAKRYTVDFSAEKISLFSKMIQVLSASLASLSQQVAEFLKKKPVIPLSPVIDNVPLPDYIRPPEPHVSRIEDWGKAIQRNEGYGTAKAISITNYFNPGAIKGPSGSFLKFPNYEAGFAYLCDYLTRACNGKHIAYPAGGETTLCNFTRIYVGPSDYNYYLEIAGDLKVAPDIKISNLL